jgi:hypothetical protein
MSKLMFTASSQLNLYVVMSETGAVRNCIKAVSNATTADITPWLKIETLVPLHYTYSTIGSDLVKLRPELPLLWIHRQLLCFF